METKSKYVIVHFLTESLGEDRVRVFGPFDSAEEAITHRDAGFTRATRNVTIVKLG